LDPELAMGLLQRFLAGGAHRRRGPGSATPPPEATAEKKRQGSPPATPTHPLSPRELEVLRLVALGETNQQIAQELHIGLSTVKRNVEHILLKLGVSDRTQAVVKAIELRLLPEGEGGSSHS
jgi:DNA-binding NarL/FixJ family response regulator